MNLNPVVSFVAAANLTGKEYSVVKLTSTGVDLAASGDAVIGTLLRAQPHQEDGVYIGKSVAVQLWTSGVQFGMIGASTAAIAKGDALAIDPANPGRIIPAGANPVIGISVQAFTAVIGAVVEFMFAGGAVTDTDPALTVPQLAEADITAADGTTTGTTQTLANATKATVNSLLAKLRTAGIIAP